MLYVNPLTAHSFSAVDPAPGSKGREAEVLREYEQLFIYQMLKAMRKTIPDYGVVDSAHRQHFDEMLDDVLAGEMARSGHFGIARQLAEQIALAAAPQAPANAEGIPLRKALTGIPLSEDGPAGLPVTLPRRGIEIYKELSGPRAPAAENRE